MAIIFVGLWVGLTVPIALSVVFALLKPIVISDNTGISMLIIGLLVAFIDGYIGIKIYEKKIDPWLDRRKKKEIFRN
jgi:archaellum biogenesis protein FlaJ (TadC family)